jgi:hypothetical protein
MNICTVGGRVVLCGQTDGQTDMLKLIVAFRTFANAPENGGKIATVILQNAI